MNPKTSHDLGPHVGAWRTWIRKVLGDRSQKEFAAEIQEAVGDDKSKKTAVNRFLQGIPDEIEKWFDDRPGWLEILVQGTAMDAQTVWERFWQIQRGDMEPVSWHPAFPALSLHEVEIRAPLFSMMGADAEAIAKTEVGRLSEPDHWSAAHPPDPIKLVAPPGRRRDIAARQLEEALRRELERVAAGKPVPFGVKMDPSGKDDGMAGKWRIIVRSPERGDGVGSFVELAPWGSSEAVALARRLAASDRLAGGQRKALEAFAEVLSRNPSMLGSSLTVDLIIRLLAEVARNGCPDKKAGVRDLLTRAAWTRAETGAERLPAFDERLMEGICAEMALRDRSPTEAGGWTCGPRSALAAIIESVARRLVGVSAGRPLVKIVDEIDEARGDKQRRAAMRSLRQALAADPITPLMEEMITGHLLQPVEAPMDHLMRLPEPVLAAAWAARGLGGMPSLDGHWERLLDPDWGLLMEEMARRGARFDELASKLQDASPELRVDAAIWLLRHAIATADDVRDPRLIEAWASVLWASSHGLFRIVPAYRYRWNNDADSLLWQVSWRYRSLLPAFGDDALAVVAVHVPASVKDLVGRWRSLSSDRTGVEQRMRSRSPFQHNPDHPARWAARGADGLAVFEDLLRTLKDGDPMEQRLLELGAGLGPEIIAPWCSRMATEFLGDQGSDFTMGIVMSLAERMRLIPFLEKIAQVPRQWLPAARMRCKNGVMSIHVPGQRPITIRPVLGDRQDEGYSALSLPVAEVMDRWEDLAERAAVVLHRLGRSHELRRRWREGGTPCTELLTQDRRRHCALLRLLLTVPAAWGRWAAQFQDANTREGTPRHLERLVAELAIHATSFKEEDGEMLESRLGLSPLVSLEAIHRVGAAYTNPVLHEAIRGARHLLMELPDDLPGELAAFLDALGSDWRDGLPGEPWSMRAAKALVELEDDAPLLAWARGEDLGGEPSKAGFSAGQAVHERIKVDAEYLERAWKAYEGATDARPAAEMQASPNPFTMRHHLLSMGSLSRSEGQTFPSSPLPFVVREARTSKDPALIEYLTGLNKGSPAWIKVIKKHMRAQDPRSSAYWALLLADAGGDATGAGVCLKHWLLHDSSPFSGGDRWQRVDDRYVGGARDLLKAALDIQEGWVIEGLTRLWHEAIRLPIRLDRTPWVEPTASTVLWYGLGCPWPLSDLADALAQRGRGDLVLETWRAPPPEPTPDPDELQESRPDLLRWWLDRWWLRLAPDMELYRFLTGAEPFHHEAANQLLERGFRGLAPAAERAAGLEEPDFRILAKVAPERLIPAFMNREATGWESVRMGLIGLLDGASLPGWENPDALWEARRALARLNPSVA